MSVRARSAHRKPSLKRLAWVTDIHLNFLKQQEIQAFCKLLDDQNFPS